MSGRGAFRDGIRRVTRARAVLLGTVALTCPVALPRPIRVRDMFGAYLGRTATAEVVAAGPGRTLPPSITGLAAILENASRLLDNRPLSATIGGTAAWLVLWSVPSGGVLGRYAGRRPTTLRLRAPSERGGRAAERGGCAQHHNQVRRAASARRHPTVRAACRALVTPVAGLHAAAPGAPPSGAHTWLVLAVGEAYIIGRHHLKLLADASERSLFQAVLAHCADTAAPLVVWPGARSVERPTNAAASVSPAFRAGH